MSLAIGYINITSYGFIGYGSVEGTVHCRLAHLIKLVKTSTFWNLLCFAVSKTQQYVQKTYRFKHFLQPDETSKFWNLSFCTLHYNSSKCKNSEICRFTHLFTTLQNAKIRKFFYKTLKFWNFSFYTHLFTTLKNVKIRKIAVLRTSWKLVKR